MKSLRQFSFLTNFVQTMQFVNQFSLDNLVFQKTQTIQFFLPVLLQYVLLVCKYIYYFSGTTVIKIILFFNWVLINQFLFVQSRKYFYQFSETNIFIVETFFASPNTQINELATFLPLDAFKRIFNFRSLICVFCFCFVVFLCFLVFFVPFVPCVLFCAFFVLVKYFRKKIIEKLKLS